METAGADGDVTYMYAVVTAVVTAVAHILSFKNMHISTFFLQKFVLLYLVYIYH